MPSPEPATFASENFTVREMLETLLGSDGKRKIRLHRKTNAELFATYEDQLALRHRSPDAREEAKRVLGHFKNFLGEFPPSPELATSFLARFSNHKPTTLYRYHSIINSFMTWYGDPLTTKIRVPESIPQYIETDAIAKLKDAMRGKKTHKKIIERNILIIDLGLKAGLRREEISNLKVSDVDLNKNYLIVREGKEMKDRIVDLTPSLAAELEKYISGKSPSASLFNLTPSTISGLITWAAKKANVEIHTHSLRHHFAQQLVDNGTDIETVRRLLGHKSLNTTQVYLARNDAQRKQAIARLEMPDNQINQADMSIESKQAPISVIEEVKTKRTEQDKTFEKPLEQKPDSSQNTTLSSHEVDERRSFEGKYTEEWEHFKKIRDALINLQHVSVDERSFLIDIIMRERIFLNDTELQERLDSFIVMEEHMTRHKIPMLAKYIASAIALLSRRMNKRYPRKK